MHASERYGREFLFTDAFFFVFFVFLERRPSRNPTARADERRIARVRERIPRRIDLEVRAIERGMRRRAISRTGAIDAR